jgi:hypothetical protein
VGDAAAQLGTSNSWRFVSPRSEFGSYWHFRDAAMTWNVCEYCSRSSFAAVLFVVLCPPATAAPHSVDELFRPSVVRDAALSPGGTRVALIYRAE